MAFLILCRMTTWLALSLAVGQVLSGQQDPPTGEGRTLKIAYVGPSLRAIPYLSIMAVETTGPAISLAVEDATKKGMLQNINVSVLWRDDMCEAKQGMAVAVQLQEEGVDMVTGLVCSAVSAAVGHYWSYQNIPMFSSASSDVTLSDKVIYNTLVRVGPSYNKYGAAFVEVFRHFGWTRTVMLVWQDKVCDYGATSIDEAFYNAGLTVAEWIQVPKKRTITDEDIDWYLEKVRQRSRVVILCMGWTAIKRILLRAWRSGMTAHGDYVFFKYTSMPYEVARFPWGDTSEDDFEEVKLAFRSYKMLTMASMSGPDVDSFTREVMERLSDPPWDDLESAGTGSLLSLTLYDAVYLYLMLVNETIAEGGDYKDGNLLAQKARGRSFYGKSGHVMLDANADRDPDLGLWHLPPGEDGMTYWADVRTTSPIGQRMDNDIESFWHTEGNVIPPDVPVCGFNQELCKPGQDLVLVGGLGAGSVAAIGIVIAVLVFLRKRMLDHQLYEMVWKLNFNDIQFVANANKSARSSVTTFSRSQTVSSKISLLSNTIPKNLCLYKGTAVFVKHFDVGSLVLNKADLRHLKEMKEVSHENINIFVGASVESPNICGVTTYCHKGSLEDILQNEDVTLDMTFKYSLTSDLANPMLGTIVVMIQGMQYLHNHPINTHGNLKSSNCLVDSRWVLKLSSFGLHPIKRELKAKDTGEYKKFKALLWTAPELLRKFPRIPIEGTQKGDVYSFGIILQEILYRSPPYFMDIMSPKDVFNRVKVCERPPFRPRLPDTCGFKVHPIFLDMMVRCWLEDPADRPPFTTIRRMIRAFNMGRNLNIVDNMLRRLEKYANNLEDLVQQRTEALVEEKKKTDTLLYRMLPRTIAEELKTGKMVKPEVYENVSIYFSDIVEFTVLCASSTAVQVVTLLNDLYTLFDTTIGDYDVYKVETIGDAYMVVSGLPKRNGDRHIAQIADMSLALLSAVLSFRVRHEPEHRIELRIGIHSGHCAAGVVGVSMPRYCLFGDTVNMAARMESNGEASKIHLSLEANEALLQHKCYHTAPRGLIPIKGKGMQTTYWLLGKGSLDECLS